MTFSDLLIFLIPILAFFLVTFLWGLLRGLAKVRFRGILVVSSAVLAVISTIILKNYIATESFVNDVVLPMFDAFMEGEQVEMISSFLGVSPTLNEVLLGCIGSLIAPLLCVAFFLVYCIITWIVFAIVSLCTSASLKRQNAKSKLKPLRILIWALVQTLVVTAIYMIPISVYSKALSTVMNEMAESDMLDDSADGDTELVKTVLDPVDKNPITVAYRAVGGDLICNLVTDFKVDGTTVHLNDEVGAVTSFSCEVYQLTQTKLANMSKDEADVMKGIADSIEKSALLSTITGEVVYTVADNWKANEDFLGVEKPYVEDVFVPLMDTLVDIFHKDSKNIPALRADLHTLADLVTSLSKHDILADLEHPDALISKMNGGDAIKEMTDILNANESMKVLVPKITEMGTRAIANSLGLSPDEVKLSEQFMGDMAGLLNDVKGMDRDTQVNEINNRLETEFANAGLTVEREQIESYSNSMINDLLDKQEEEEITESDMQAFFITYALDEIQKQQEAGNEDFKDFNGNLGDYGNLIPKTEQ